MIDGCPRFSNLLILGLISLLTTYRSSLHSFDGMACDTGRHTFAKSKPIVFSLFSQPYDILNLI